MCVQTLAKYNQCFRLGGYICLNILLSVFLMFVLYALLFINRLVLHGKVSQLCQSNALLVTFGFTSRGSHMKKCIFTAVVD